MRIKERIELFDALGERIEALIENINNEKEFAAIIQKASFQNPWFTEESILSAFGGILKFLKKEQLENFTSKYKLVEGHNPKEVAVIMAGNIPLVGFHDFMITILSGHKIQAKLSSKDTVLFKYLISLLIDINPEISEYIKIVEGKISNFDAVIATGSDNTAKQFEFYFKKYPHIIRRNRTSVAILSGDETEIELQKLGGDIFQYFGLGCRNVSKLFLPMDYDISPFMEAIENFKYVVNHNKYVNNYEYYKSIFLINGDKHLDNGFLILKEEKNIYSPISVVNYEYYNSLQTIKDSLSESQDKIQCVVSNTEGFWDGKISLGETQTPSIDDYADGVDTMEFLVGLY